MPSRDEDEDQNKASHAAAEFQIDMMRQLREVNVDNNTVGWYQSAFLGSQFTDASMIEAQFHYQSKQDIRRAIVLCYDPLRTGHGSLDFRAYRLSDKFFKLYRQKNFTKESLAENNVSFKDVFQEIPVKIVTSTIMRAMILQLAAEYPEDVGTNFDSLELTWSPFLEKNLDVLIDCISDLQAEQNENGKWLRQVGRLQQQQQQFLQKRKAENAQRKANGDATLPESLKELEVENPQLFKLPAEPSKMESLLIANQINYHCEQIIGFGGQTVTKLYMASSLKENAPQQQ
jgi:translation initiation factor 3 subunit H